MAELCPENDCTGYKPLNNVCVLKCKLHMMLLLTKEKDEREVDYWKSEVITFVVEFCFQSSSVVDIKVKVKLRNRVLSVRISFIPS